MDRTIAGNAVSYADIFNLARKTVLKIQSEARHAAAEAEANDLRRVVTYLPERGKDQVHDQYGMQA